MKKILILLIALFTSVVSFAGSVKLSEAMRSVILGDTVKYAVYLPDNYRTSGKSYPVLYLLHGYTDDQTAWCQRGNIRAIADKAIADGSACEMIIVMPDARDSWYVNSFDGKVRFEDAFIKEFIPFVDKTYRTKADKLSRAVAGLSMGGHGALLYSVKYPQQFGACVALSAAVFTDIELKTSAKRNFGKLFERIFGAGVPNDYWKKNDVLTLMAAMPESQKKSVKFWIDCGDDDFLYRGNSMLHIIMRENGIPHEFRVRNGGHSWSYWQSAMPEALSFITKVFSEKS